MSPRLALGLAWSSCMKELSETLRAKLGRETAPSGTGEERLGTREGTRGESETEEDELREEK